MLNLSDLFDERFYLGLNPDVANAVATGIFSSGLEHYTLLGQFENRRPSALFDPGYYRGRNTDVSAAIEAGLTTGIQHYINFGQFERRDPFSLFDTQFYLDRNPDVNAAVQRDELTGVQHYVTFGQLEGRDPSALFNTSYYLERYPDVAAAVNNGAIASAIAHYVIFGIFEDRQTTPPDSAENANAAIALDPAIGSSEVRDFVGTTDPVDLYRFILDRPSNAIVAIDGLSADADLELIEDLNGNGLLESLEIFAESSEFGTAAETIAIDGLAAGTYFVRVSQFEGDTNYTLMLSATPI